MTEHESDSPKFKVMVVDDSRLSRRVLVQELSEFESLEISEHESPIEAFKVIDEFNPDLIISDYEMPKMNGLKFCKVTRPRFIPDTFYHNVWVKGVLN